MGRGKLKAELITNERSRMITYQKRKRGLIKKVEEFNILCDVDTCVIIYRPQLKCLPADLEVWPADSNKVKYIIDKYKNNGPDVRATKTQDLSDYFVARKKKVEDDIAKLRKASLEASFPGWSNDLNFLTLAQLLGLEKALDAKIEAVEGRILETKSNAEGSYSDNHSSWLSYNFGLDFHQRNMELELLLKRQPIPSANFQFDVFMPQSYPSYDQMTFHQMLPFNAEELSQFGGMTGSKIPYNTPFKDTTSYCDSSTSVLENAKLNNFPVAFPASCYSYNVQPAMPYLQGPMLPNSPTQMRELYDGHQFKKGSI